MPDSRVVWASPYYAAVSAVSFFTFIGKSTHSHQLAVPQVFIVINQVGAVNRIGSLRVFMRRMRLNWLYHR